MTPFLKIHEELRHGPKRYAEILAGTGIRKTALTDSLNDLCERGDIRRVARGTYALAGSPEKTRAKGKKWTTAILNQLSQTC